MPCKNKWCDMPTDLKKSSRTQNLIPLYLWTRLRPSTTLILESADVIRTFEVLPGRNYSRNYYLVRQEAYNDKKKYCVHILWSIRKFVWAMHLKSSDFLLTGLLFLILQVNLFLLEKLIICSEKVKEKVSHSRRENMMIWCRWRGTRCIINMAVAFMGTN
jgi:hypothetical protein